MSIPLPDLNEFFKNTSPYTTFQIVEGDRNILFELLYGINSIDCYCVECNSVTVYKPEDKRPERSYNANSRSTYTITRGEDWLEDFLKWDCLIERKFRCSRNSSHIMYHFLLIKDKTLQKIGQYPSLADMNSFEIQKFKNVLGNTSYREFNKAIGLFSHGVGAGSLVYLRRIIENFILKPAYEEAKKKDGWDEDVYNRSRIKEKMQLLEEFLPKFLLDNKILYSIISKGIHELSEEECLKYFPVLKSSLELVLIEIEEKRRIDLKKQELAKQLGSISGELK